MKSEPKIALCWKLKRTAGRDRFPNILRHPVVLPGNVFARLISTHATDLKQFLAGCEIAECPSDDPGLDLDIDRPEDYAKAQAAAGLGNT